MDNATGEAVGRALTSFQLCWGAYNDHKAQISPITSKRDSSARDGLIRESVMLFKAKLMLLVPAACLFTLFSAAATAQSTEPAVASDVNVVNTPDVNVVNTPTRIPWSAQWNVTATGFNKSIEILTFPDDFPDDSYLLVIETISYQVEMPKGQKINLRFCFDGGDIGPFTVFMPQVAPWNDYATATYADTAHMRIYAGGGDFSGPAMKAYFSRDSSTGFADFTVNAMGYFLPQDSPSLAP